MLNPTLPKSACAALTSPYIAPDNLVKTIISGNESFDTGTEYRLQSSFGEELWLKLERAGLTPKGLEGA